MKNLLALSLLLILLAGFIPTTTAQTCDFFKDTDGSCVKKCPYPRIGDSEKKVCLESDTLCSKFWLKEPNICVSECPAQFKAQPVDQKKYQVCVPCLFQDPAGNCQENCPMDQITDFTSQKCLNQPNDCKAYFIKEQNACQNKCPPEFTPDDTKTPKVCINCKITGTCSANNGGTTTTPNTSCTLYLAADLQNCGSKCPPMQIALAKVTGQTYTQCQLCPKATPFVSYDGTQCLSKCNAGELIDAATSNCIQAAQCTSNLLIDENKNSLCAEKCRPDQQAVSTKDQPYKTCQDCPAGQTLDLGTKQCVSSCKILDPTGKICLPDIKYCIGFISSDKTKCSSSCAANQYILKGEIEGQFVCVDKCDPTLFVVQKQGKDNVSLNYCVEKCPQSLFANADKICTSVDNCTKFLSVDGKDCLDSCKQGTFPQTVKDKKAQVCMPCLQRLSSDGKTCSDKCATGELFDVKQQQCISSDKCSAIKSNDLCLPKCQPGSLLQVDGSNNKSCISISSCTDYISSDRQSCVKNCGTGEGTVEQQNQKICILCPFGLAADGKKCLTSCADGQVFDPATNKCVQKASCTGILSANGKRCVVECEFPEVKPSSSATQCAYSCQKGQLFQDHVGCIDPSNCQGYQSADGQFCVDSCDVVRQVVANSNSTPKTCQKCPEGQYPQVQQDKSVICADRNSDSLSDIKDQLSNALKPAGGDGISTPTQKDAVKGILKSVTKDLESQISTALKDTTATDKLQTLLKDGISTLKSSIFDFLKNINSYDASTNVDQSNNQIQDQSQIVLGTSTLQIVAEKQKKGFAFKVKFNLKDLVSGSSVSLQQDNSQVPQFGSTSATTGQGIGDATGQTDSTITAMQITHLASNPNCSTCPTGLTTIDAQTSGRLRNLQAAGGQTYQLTYQVDPSQIQKTICVSYDANNSMSVNPTILDTTKNQITCTFTTNSSLYYDSTCQYVSKTLCQTTDTNNPKGFDSSITSGSLLSTIAALSLLLLANL